MSFVDIDELETLQQTIPAEIENLVNTLAIDFREAAETTMNLMSLYASHLINITSKSDSTVDMTKDFILKCENLEENLQNVEKLAKQINFMRRYCEELEKKINKTF
ncbi:unnamed protein product [Blepharisma stoltei]|uniref:BLOC-1-related complex subunit 6 C-terminal helix domain-containing protein n=1 Tax=Blepharisma stoltei TaxID=1481888 RepID=A0AAU9KCV6_9CILI|nr:unnamed protein product [Blepharisma stoltei]